MLRHLEGILAPRETVNRPVNMSDHAREDGFEYDLVTIGAGSGGVRASRLAAPKYGRKVI